MIAGRLDTVLTVWLPRSEEDRNGQLITRWLEKPMIRAGRTRLTPTGSAKTAEAFAGYDATYDVRSYHEVTTGWRVQEPGMPVMAVENVLTNRRRGYKSLLCRKIND